MSRRRMEPGERGEIYWQQTSTGWRAMQYFRNRAGRRRRALGVGPTKDAAKRALKRNVDSALAAGGGGFKSSTRFEVAVAEWLAMVEQQVERGARSPTTYDQYERNARIHVLPAIGGVKLSELTTGRLHLFLTEVHDTKGYATAKISRTILSGTCGLLMRRDALASNPVRDVGRIEQGAGHAPRALSVAEAHAFLELLDANEFARRKDLPDLVRFLLATGVRIGEALALTWSRVDLVSGEVVIDATVVRVKGKGLIRKTTKSDTSDRRLMVPGWCVAMLSRRYVGQAGDRPVFPDSIGGWRDRSNVARDLRTVRADSSYSWVKSHTARRTVATLLDDQGMTARKIADQLGHARPSMTQDVYMGRRAVEGVAVHLEGLVLPAAVRKGLADKAERDSDKSSESGQEAG